MPGCFPGSTRPSVSWGKPAFIDTQCQFWNGHLKVWLLVTQCHLALRRPVKTTLECRDWRWALLTESQWHSLSGNVITNTSISYHYNYKSDSSYHRGRPESHDWPAITACSLLWPCHRGQKTGGLQLAIALNLSWFLHDAFHLIASALQVPFFISTESGVLLSSRPGSGLHLWWTMIDPCQVKVACVHHRHGHERTELVFKLRHSANRHMHGRRIQSHVAFFLMPRPQSRCSKCLGSGCFRVSLA